MDSNTKANCKHFTNHAVVIKADGTKVDLGLVEGYHSNPFINLFYRFQTFLTNLKIKRFNESQKK